MSTAKRMGRRYDRFRIAFSRAPAVPDFKGGVLVRSLASFILALCLLAAGASSVRAADPWTKGPGYLTEALGDESAPTPGAVHGGFLLSGGGDWNLAAFRWFAAHAGNGHIVGIFDLELFD